ncbi:tyrosine-type recombinase/integrase [Nocardioides kribbensis]|uniref:Site-specific integrase n=1 Tax=Nocardioides kribbensis TaxID=305517 RepID=A0ABV1NZ73_9ACTN
MGWAEKMPSGKYRGVYRDGDGKKRSAGVYAHKAAAKRAAGAKEELSRASLQRNPEAYKRPWGEWCDEWWPTRNVEASTLKVDGNRLRRHVRPQWGGVAIGSITRQDVKAWCASMRADGLGPTTVQRCAHLLSASLSAAMDAEIIDSNPAANLKLAGSAQAQERFLTRAEFKALRDQMETTGDQLIVDVAVYTGMRPGEWAGLHWNRVDLERGLIRVVETFDEPGGRMKVYPKSKRVRDIPLTPELVTALRELKEEVGDTTTGCGVPHSVGECRSSLVLRTAGGSVVRNSNWSPRWRRAVAAAGIGHARPYDLRHTFASWLLQAGVPLAEVGRLMGHTSVQTTAIYAHLAETPSASILSALAAPLLPREEVETA